MSASTLAAVRARAAQGRTGAEIARALGLSTQAVHHVGPHTGDRMTTSTSTALDNVGQQRAPSAERRQDILNMQSQFALALGDQKGGPAMSPRPESPRLSTMRDRLVSRCSWCGDWRYGARDCDTCGTAAPAEVVEAPRRPNVGKRWDAA